MIDEGLLENRIAALRQVKGRIGPSPPSPRPSPPTPLPPRERGEGDGRGGVQEGRGGEEGLYDFERCLAVARYEGAIEALEGLKAYVRRVERDRMRQALESLKPGVRLRF